jgi:tetratricopeptide (TPR) repeat protein
MSEAPGHASSDAPDVPKSDPMASLPDRGRLIEYPLPRLLFDLYKARFSGLLALETERVKKTVQLHEGIPGFVESNLASESLGVQLMDDGIISREDYARVVGYVGLKKCKEGKALLELRLLQPKQLFAGLKEQVRRRVVECFGWPDGEFRLDPREAPPEDAQAFSSDPIALLQSGLETHWTPDRILTALGDRLALYAKPSARFARVRRRLETDAPSDAMVEVLDGSRSLGEIAVKTRSARALAQLWILDAMGVLEYADAPIDSAQPPPEEDEAPALQPEIEIVVNRGGNAAGGAAPPPEAGTARTDAPRQAPNADAETLRQDILDTHARLRELDHYEILAVDPKAPPAKIRRAYFKLAKRYHPDALVSAGLDTVRAQANDIFAQVSKAHEVLSDMMRRRDYDKSLEAGGGEEEDMAARVANAEVLYRKAEILLRRGNFKGALEFLKPAVQLWPDDTEYQSALGWALFKQPKAETKPARQHLEKAVEIDTKNALALYRLSVVLRSDGDANEAASLLARAKAIDPKVDRRS